MLSEERATHANFDVQIYLALCLSQFIRITAPNPPFEDELMKKVFRVIVSPFQAPPECADKSYHKRVRKLESMSRVKSYVVLLDPKRDTLVPRYFPQSFSINQR